MAGNLVLISGFEAKSITCKVASSESVTAGAFVKSEAGNDAVTISTSAGSMADYTTGDITISECDDGSTDYQVVIGICAEDGAAGAFVKVFVTGIFMVRASESITAGQRIQSTETSDPYEVDALDTDTSAANWVIGKALTGASAGDKYIIAHLNFG